MVACTPYVQETFAISYSLPVLAELRGLAEESLQLLREAIHDERFPALFSLDVYGSIIGMFELNNLGALQLIFFPYHSPLELLPS